MAELSISPDEIRDALKDFAASYEPKKAEKTEVGTVVDAADGIAHVAGLPGVMANELVRFEDGTLGLAQNLEEDEIGVVVLGEFTEIAEGTVYALLVRLEQRGLVDVERVPSEKGPPRKVYTINAEGRTYLDEFWRTWSFLSDRLAQLREGER